MSEKRKKRRKSEESGHQGSVTRGELCTNRGLSKSSSDVFDLSTPPELVDFGSHQFVKKKNSGNDASSHEHRIGEDGSGIPTVLDLCTPPEVPDLFVPPLRKKKTKRSSHGDGSTVGGDGSGIQLEFASTSSEVPESSLPPPDMKKKQKKMVKESTGNDYTGFSKDEKVICNAEDAVSHGSSSEVRELSSPPSGRKKDKKKPKKSSSTDGLSKDENGSLAVENEISHGPSSEVCELSLPPSGMKKEKKKRKKASSIDGLELPKDENRSRAVEDGISHGPSSEVCEYSSYPSGINMEKKNRSTDSRELSKDGIGSSAVEIGTYHSRRSEGCVPSRMKEEMKRKRSSGVGFSGFHKYENGSVVVENGTVQGKSSGVCDLTSSSFGAKEEKAKWKKTSGRDHAEFRKDENINCSVEKRKSQGKSSEVSEIRSSPSGTKKEKAKRKQTTATDCMGFLKDETGNCHVDNRVSQGTGPEVRELGSPPSQTKKARKRFLGSDNTELQNGESGVCAVETDVSSEIAEDSNLPIKAKWKRSGENGDSGLKCNDGFEGDSSMEFRWDDATRLPDLSTLLSNKKRSRQSSPNDEAGKRSSIASSEIHSNGVVYGNDLQDTQPVIPSSKESMNKKKKTVRFQVPDEDVHEENVSYIPADRKTEADTSVSLDVRNWKSDFARQDLLYGKFRKEEDESIKASVNDYIRSRGWEVNEGVQTVLHSSHHKGVRGCWIDIAKCLPYRPVKQINARAHILFGAEMRGKWSKEELDLLKKLHDEHGSNWKKIGALIGRSGQLCKDKWRRLQLAPTRKLGTWTQDELDKLCKLVRRSLRVKQAIPPRKFDRRELRDDINWEWICGEMKRDNVRCADAWYDKLASPMIKEKRWASGDDRLLLQRLMELGATSDEAVDWDSVLDHRDGQTSMERWREMTRLLGKRDHAPFEEKVDVLAERYAPDLLGIEEEP